MGLDNGFRYRLIAEDALTSCWKLENEYGNIMQAGYYYGYDFEWDGALLLTQFDSVNKNAGCSVGSSFLVIVDEVKCELYIYINANLSIHFDLLIFDPIWYDVSGLKYTGFSNCIISM